MKVVLSQLVATRSGTFAILLLAAFLEAYGDSCFQQGLYRSTGATRYAAFFIGALTLTFYGLVVNTTPWDFGKLIGIYVVLFFVVAQFLAWARFQQLPTVPIIVGGSLIVTGGMVITLWRQ